MRIQRRIEVVRAGGLEEETTMRLRSCTVSLLAGGFAGDELMDGVDELVLSKMTGSSC